MFFAYLGKLENFGTFFFFPINFFFWFSFFVVWIFRRRCRRRFSIGKFFFHFFFDLTRLPLKNWLLTISNNLLGDDDALCSRVLSPLLFLVPLYLTLNHCLLLLFCFLPSKKKEREMENLFYIFSFYTTRVFSSFDFFLRGWIFVYVKWCCCLPWSKNDFYAFVRKLLFTCCILLLLFRSFIKNSNKSYYILN